MTRAQSVPQAPQFVALVWRLTSQPSVGSRLQSAKPAVQLPTPHVPATHAAVALGSEHTRPQPPQFRASVCTFASQPLASLPSQFP